MISEITPDKNIYKTKRYWPVPPYVQSIYQYQNINNDNNLQKDVTLFFHTKLLLWINKESKFKQYKYLEKKLDTNNGIKFIYKLLKKFISKTNINWYDLRDNYYLIKKYILIKLPLFNID